VCYRLAQYEDAAAAFRKAIELHPAGGIPSDHFALAGIYHQRCETEQAHQAYRRALELDQREAVTNQITVQQFQQWQREIGTLLGVPTRPHTPDPSHLVLEGEHAVGSARASSGLIWRERLISGIAHLRWTPLSVGARLAIPFDVPRSARYRISAQFSKGADFGQFRLLIDGMPVGQPLDGYSPRIVASDEIVLGDFSFEAGERELVFEITGRNPESTGHVVGIVRCIVTPLEPGLNP
jgi:tetratricopeptide (TPR) repeat protein